VSGVELASPRIPPPLGKFGVVPAAHIGEGAAEREYALTIRSGSFFLLQDRLHLLPLVGSQVLNHPKQPLERNVEFRVHGTKVNDPLVGLSLVAIGSHGAAPYCGIGQVCLLFSELYENNGWVYSFIEGRTRQAMVGLFPQAPLHVLGGVVLRL